MLRGIFARGGTEERVTGQEAWGAWPGDYSSASGGVRVTEDSAMMLLAVYGSVRLITDQISTLPVDTYRKAGDARIEVPKPYWLEQPTPYLSIIDWLGQILYSLLLAGNAFYSVERSNGTTIVGLTPQDPNLVEVRMVNGRKVYIVAGQEFRGDMRHIPAIMKPGSLVGLSPLEAARQSIGLGLAAASHGADFFNSEGNMPGVIEIPGRAQPGQMEQMATAWARKRNRRNKGLPGVLEGGATWKPTGVTNEQMQFLETRQWSAAEIAGQLFLVDPSDLGIPVPGTSLTYANITDRNVRRVQVTLRPWIERIEESLSGLFLDLAFVRLNVEGLLRGNPTERFAIYEAAERINRSAVDRGEAPLMPTAEMRALEDKSPLAAATATKPPTFNEKVDMVGQLIRAGFDPESALVAVGLPPMTHLGLPPVTLQGDGLAPPPPVAA